MNNRTDERIMTSVSRYFALPNTSLIHRIIPYGLSASLLRLIMYLSVPSFLQGCANRAGQMSTSFCNAILNNACYLVQPVESVMSSVANGVTTSGTFAYGVARQGVHRLEPPVRAFTARVVPVYNAVRDGSQYVIDPVQAVVSSAATVAAPVYHAVRDGSHYILTSSVSLGTAVASHLPTVSMPTFTPFARPAAQPSASQHNVGQ